MATSPRAAGELLRSWRVRRRLSQLELASDAEVSTRHLSFVETGRARPSRELLLHLAEHLAEVPAIVIPTIIGRHDGSTRPGLFDSVIQAAWSFCLALRARGLGTAWVTAALQDEAKVKALLGIPEHMTEIVLFPVAWTKGRISSLISPK